LGGPSSALGLPAGLGSVCLAGRGSSRLPPTEARILSSDAGFNRRSSENLLVDLFWWCRSKLSESTTVKSECRVRGLWFCASRSRRCSIWSSRAPIARGPSSSSKFYLVSLSHVFDMRKRTSLYSPTVCRSPRPGPDTFQDPALPCLPLSTPLPSFSFSISGLPPSTPWFFF
jgi:hypothetical protein